MNHRSNSAYAHTSAKQLIEHTPIYDMDAYNQRQRQIQFKIFLKNVRETVVFIAITAFIFSMLWWRV
jgi:hypothetical protein